MSSENMSATDYPPASAAAEENDGPVHESTAASTPPAEPAGHDAVDGELPPPAEEWQDDDSAQQRFSCIGSYVAQELQSPNLLAANLSAVNGDLMRLQYAVSRIASRMLAHPDVDLNDLAAAGPAIDSGLRLAKQISSISSMLVKLEARDN